MVPAGPSTEGQPAKRKRRKSSSQEVKENSYFGVYLFTFLIHHYFKLLFCFVHP